MKTENVVIATGMVILLAFSLPSLANVKGFVPGKSHMGLGVMVPHYGKYGASQWFGEQYHYTAQLGKYKLNVDFRFSNLGLSKGKCAVSTMLVLPGGKKVIHTDRFTREQWSYKTDAFFVKAGDNTMSGKPGAITVTFKNSTLQGSMTFRNALRPWRPGKGRVRFPDGTFYDFSLQAPRAYVTAEVTHAGQTLKLKGTGYSDHSFTNIAPHEMFKRFIRVRRVSGKHTLILSMFQTPPRFGGKWVTMLYVAMGRKVIAERLDVQNKPTSFKVDSAHVNHYKVPLEFLVRTTDGNVQGRVRAVRMLRRSDALKNLSRLERFFVSKFAKPVDYEFRAEYVFVVKNGTESQKLESNNSMYIFQQLNK